MASLKEEEAKMYGFSLMSESRVSVKVQATPKNVNVYLMSPDQWERFKKVVGQISGGQFSYHRQLSRQSILSMEETSILPPGAWSIVVQRPHEALLFGDDTTAQVDVTVY